MVGQPAVLPTILSPPPPTTTTLTVAIANAISHEDDEGDNELVETMMRLGKGAWHPVCKRWQNAR